MQQALTSMPEQTPEQTLEQIQEQIGEPTLPSFLSELTSGSLAIRIADTEADIKASQALRYRVFYEEMKAKPSDEMAAMQRDFDAFDAVADHLLVVDRDLGTGPEAVVGTYRLIRKEAAQKIGRFYTVDEYDISALLNQDMELLELGRSCVDERYRNRIVMELLWRGIAAYVFHYRIDVMFGCASLPGNDVEALKLPLSYLYHNHLAPEDMRPVALPERYTKMDLLAPDEFEMKKGLMAVPSLVKGYLRLGGFVGDGAVIDPQFNTTDVCVIVQTEKVTGRYFEHYTRRTGGG